MIAIYSSHIPVKRKTSNYLQWQDYIKAELRISRGFDKHKKDKKI